MSNRSDKVPASQLVSDLMGRLRVGKHLPPPYGHVTDAEIVHAAETLQKLSAPLNTALPHELRDIAEKAIGRTDILEQRQKKLRVYLDGFADQCMRLPDGDPIRTTFEQMFNVFDMVLKGEK